MRRPVAVILFAALLALPARSAPAARPGPSEGEGRLLARPHPGPRADAAPPTGTIPLGLGGARDGLLFVPAGYDSRRPAALLVLLHGAGGSAERILARFRPSAERHGLLVLAPDSRGPTWDLVVEGGFHGDVAFLEQALAQVFARYAVDPAHVALGGFSDGASYTLSLGLANGDLFHQLLAFSPGFVAAPALAGQPRIFVTHGTADEILPIERASRRLVPALRRLGYAVRYVELDGPHRVPDDQIVDEALTWLAAE